MKRMFKYFLAVVICYIFVSIATPLIIKSTKVELDDQIIEIGQENFEWSDATKNPMLWFLGLGALVVILP